jgi:uncharacterized protein (TIRG00374 family)
MKTKLLKIAQYVFFMGGGLFLVWWQFHDIQPKEKQEFIDSLQTVNYWYLIPVAFMSIASHISRSARWKLMMQPMNYQPRLMNVFSTTMVGYLANSAVPRLGELLKCTLLARYEKLRADKLIGTILLERSFDMVCYLVFILITFLLQMDIIGDYLGHQLNLFSGERGYVLLLKFSIFIFIIAFVVWMIRFLFKKFPKNTVINSVSNTLSGISEGVKSIRQLKSVKLFLFHSLFIWLMYLGQIYLGFMAMEGTAHLTIPAACSVLTLATLAMIVTPGGIGSFPYFVMQTLALYHIDHSLGIAFGWIMWGASTAIVIIFGLISLLILPYLNRETIKT